MSWKKPGTWHAVLQTVLTIVRMIRDIVTAPILLKKKQKKKNEDKEAMAIGKLSEYQTSLLFNVAERLNVDPDDLYKLIDFESGWNPQIKNPNSSARGLIQFTDGTARTMGFNDSTDLVSKYPNIESQLLGPVSDYLARHAPFESKQALYMAVFYPVAMSWEPGRQFPANVQAVNPGIVTVQDFINKVNRRADPRIVTILVAALAGIIILTMLQRG